MYLRELDSSIIRDVGAGVVALDRVELHATAYHPGL